MTDSAKNDLRLDYLDICKALAIFLVIWGHAVGNLDTPYYRLILYSFHMPLFFLISGIVMKHRKIFDFKTRRAFIGKQFFALMVPYIIWALIYTNFSYFNLPKILYGSWEDLNALGTFTSLWFLPCLFVARVLMECVMRLADCCKEKFGLSCRLTAFASMVLAFAAGFALPKLEHGYFLGFNVALVALGFMLLGYSAKWVLLIFSQRNRFWHLLAFFAFAALYVLGLALNREGITLVLMCNGTYGNLFFFFYYALTGGGAFLALSMLLACKSPGTECNFLQKVLIRLGRSTLGIYLIHKNILQELVMPWLAELGITQPLTLATLAGACLTLPLTWLIFLLVDNFVPQLLGKYSRRQLRRLEGNQK